jgi:hypothetical protein
MTGMTLVVGVHRSGTSLLAAGLPAIGPDVGRLSAGRGGDDPHAHFETQVIRTFNDRLLQERGTSWHDRSFGVERAGLGRPGWAGWRGTAAALLHKQYGWRRAAAPPDPLIAQRLPFWTRMFEALGLEQRHLLGLRHRHEIGECPMQRAARRPDMFPRMSTSQAMNALWTTLIRTVLATLPPGATITVRHDPLRADPRGVLRALAERRELRPAIPGRWTVWRRTASPPRPIMPPPRPRCPSATQQSRSVIALLLQGSSG